MPWIYINETNLVHITNIRVNKFWIRHKYRDEPYSCTTQYTRTSLIVIIF